MNVAEAPVDGELDAMAVERRRAVGNVGVEGAGASAALFRGLGMGQGTLSFGKKYPYPF